MVLGCLCLIIILTVYIFMVTFHIILFLGITHLFKYFAQQLQCFKHKHIKLKSKYVTTICPKKWMTQVCGIKFRARIFIFCCLHKSRELQTSFKDLILFANGFSSIGDQEMKEQEFDILALWTVPFGGNSEVRLRQAESNLIAEVW